MPIRLDPNGAEVDAIRDATNLRNARVLEIGAGNGRLTFRYAAEAKSVIAVDPKELEIRAAAIRCEVDLRPSVQFLCASVTALPFGARNFAIVLLASSL